ncbi:acyl carrier protein [Saccharothrix sp. Mg75]|uniref:acyl carrier protein n=1 Tax=Saccharothrix sp. Mg75 TaxID=3445357 RepID=UPI003EEAF75C
MNVASTEKTISTYLDEHVLRHTATGLENDTPLLSTGILNSLTLMQLVSFLETHFEVEVPLAEVVGQRFATVSAIADLVSELRSNGPAPFSVEGAAAAGGPAIWTRR